MDGKKLEEFTRLLTGMKRHEWSKLKIAVERMYDRSVVQVGAERRRSHTK